MKGIFILISFCLFYSSHIKAQNPSWMWAKTAGGQDADYGRAVVSDDEGNVYQTGYFNNPIITFGSVILQNSNPGFSEIYITKYNSQGNVVWAKTIEGNSSDEVYSICEDGKGHIYVAGSFDSDTLKVDTLSILNSGYQDMFILQLDSNGQANWMRNEQGLFNEVAYALAADRFGNVVVTGSYEGNSWVIGVDTIENYGDNDVFLIKYDSIGNVKWARGSGGGNYDKSSSIATDINGNVIVAGSFASQNFIADTFHLSNQGFFKGDAFLLKYSDIGDLMWVRGIGGAEFDEITCVRADAVNEVVVGGYYYSTFIKIRSDSLSNAGKADMFLAKYTAQGTPLWGRKIGGAEIDEAMSIAIDQQNNIILAGNFASPQLIIQQDVLSNHGSMDIMLARYDKNGHPYSAQSVGNSKDDVVLSVDCDKNNQVVITGYYFSLILTFGSNTIFNSTASFFPECYIAKLDSTAVIVSGVVDEPYKSNFILLYPNPANKEVNLSFELIRASDLEFEIYSITGKRMQYEKLGPMALGHHTIPIQLSSFVDGMYIIQLKTKEELLVGKLNVMNAH